MAQTQRKTKSQTPVKPSAKKKQSNVSLQLPKRKASEKEKAHYYDYHLLAIVILLASFGLIMIYSSSAYLSGTSYFIKQAAIGVACLVIACGASYLDYHLLIRLSPYLYIVTAFLLVITRFIGEEVNGAKRWIKVGGQQFQPAEIAKLAIILLLPFMIIKMGKKFQTVKGTLLVLSIGMILALLTIVFTKNLSSGIIIAGITVIMVFVAHPKSWPFVLAAIIGILVVVLFITFAYQNLETFKLSDNYRDLRIYAWLEPEGSSDEIGYQTMQALYAIGSGGFFGKGLGNGSQKLGAVPEAQNDMIFSIICEELGVFGAILVIVLFIFLLYRLLFIAQNAPDLYGSLMVTGIFAHIAIQVILNIAVVVNWIPPTGITLPFISYGGTSVLFLMAEMALALSVSRKIKFKD